jgi:hypothetical protein
MRFLEPHEIRQWCFENRIDVDDDTGPSASQRLTHIETSGTWTRNTMTNVYYFSAAPSIVVNLQSKVLAGQLWLRSSGDSAFTRLYPVEGSCNGVRTAREAIFTYTRR